METVSNVHTDLSIKNIFNRKIEYHHTPPNLISEKINLTQVSMHSSRMRTARLLAVSPSMHCSASRGMSDLGGMSASQGMSASGGCLLQGWCIPACTEADTPPVNRMTDRQV